MKSKEKNILSTKEVIIIVLPMSILGFVGGFLFGIIGAGIGGALGGLIAHSILNSMRKKKK